MSTADLIRDARPSPIRPLWCQRGSTNSLSTLLENGDVGAAAALLDRHAEERGASIVEVCRVTQGSREAIYARVEPKEPPKANPT